MITKDTAKKELDLLISQFGGVEKALEKDKISNEEEIKIQYLMPMFIALGWDMMNRQGKPHNRLEVRHQWAFKSSQKKTHRSLPNKESYRPDYNFNNADGSVAFYLDAKSVPTDIKGDKITPEEV